jgi:hypothetical protein
LSYDENTILHTIEKASKSAVNISTIRLMNNLFYQTVTSKIQDIVNEIHKKRIGDSVRLLGIRKGRNHFFELKLSQAP